MGELLVMLIIPPFIGVAIYAVLRIFWEKDEEADRIAPSRQADVN